ncbi:hypothetical protein NDU88_000965, partial [Pleurodeles waltl]
AVQSSLTWSACIIGSCRAVFTRTEQIYHRQKQCSLHSHRTYTPQTAAVQCSLTLNRYHRQQQRRLHSHRTHTQQAGAVQSSLTWNTCIT